MSVVQTGYESLPTDPEAVTFQLFFLEGEAEIGSIQPLQTNGPNYPDHTVLV